SFRTGGTEARRAARATLRRGDLAVEQQQHLSSCACAEEPAAVALREDPEPAEVADLRKFRPVEHGRTLPCATDRSRDRLCGRAAPSAALRGSRLRACRTLGGRVARR